MDMKAEVPRTKNNIFRVPVYDSDDWATMKSLDTNTIKEMNTALAEKVNTKPATAKTSRTRTRKVELGGLVASSHER